MPEEMLVQVPPAESVMVAPGVAALAPTKETKKFVPDGAVTAGI